MSTYGMTAKDRMALFQTKSTSDSSKAGPKKIGKLNVAGPAAKKEPVKKPTPKKLAKKASPPKEEKKVEGAESKKEPPKTANKLDGKKEPEAKKEEPKQEAKKEELKPEPKKEPKPEPKKEPKPEPTKEPKPEPKKEEPKLEPKKVEPTPEPQNVEPKQEAKKGEMKPEPKKAEPKPEPKKEEPKPEPKTEVTKPEVKKEEPKPEPKKEDAKPELKKEPEPEPQKEKPQPATMPQAKKEEPKAEVKETVVIKKEEVKTQGLKKEEAPKQEPKTEPAPKQETKIATSKAEQKQERKKEEAPKPASKKEEAPKPAPKKEEAPKPAPAQEKKTPKAEEKKPTPAPKKEEPKQDAKKAQMPIVEEAIDAVVVERKAKPVQPTAALSPEDEPLPEVKVVTESVPVQEVKAQAPSVEVVEEVIEVKPVKKGETVPAVQAPPPKPKPVVKTVKPMQIFKPSGEDFYNTIFYFSGMGSVVGSSLAKGIYVPNRLTTTSLDVDVVEQLENYKPVEQKRRDTVVESARNQAVDLTEELKKLRALLFGLPSWGDAANEGVLDQGSLQRIGGEAPQQMTQPAPWQGTHQGLDLISQANTAMAQDLPPPRPKPAVSPRPVHRQPPPSAPLQPAPPVAEPVIQPVADPLALASAARAAASRQRPVAPPPAPKGGVNMYGVFQGDLGHADNRPWQERYGANYQNPRPGGEVTSKGLKPWQASRLRGLEAKGYEFRQQPTKTGADFGGDAFCGAQATIELQKEDDVSSYTPFLVSGKTKAADMRKLLEENSLEPSTYNAFPRSGATQIPYCDL